MARSGRGSEAPSTSSPGRGLLRHLRRPPLPRPGRSRAAATRMRTPGPRRPGLGSNGVDALSGRERALVDLEAMGQFNEQIARTLFLGEKTVETHLRSVFRKLEVASWASWPPSWGRRAPQADP